jgi:hypothetical protein
VTLLDPPCFARQVAGSIVVDRVHPGFAGTHYLSIKRSGTNLMTESLQLKLIITSKVSIDPKSCWTPNGNKTVKVFAGESLTKDLPTFTNNA